MPFLIKFFQKHIFLLVAVFCAGLLGVAVVMQYFFSLLPCPLCIVQRFFYLLVGLSALAAYFQWPKEGLQKVWIGCMFVFASVGGAVAARQVWIQHFPRLDIDPTKCGVSFGSFLDSLILALGGVGNCAIRDFTIIRLSIPEWSLLSFGGLVFVALWLMNQNEASDTSSNQ